MTTAPAPEFPLAAVIKFMRRFVAFTNDDHAPVLGLWILHTWAFDAAYATPYIYVTSAEKQSGKTRLIEVLNLLARNPLVASSVSASSIYRVIESTRPTMFIDEVDAIFDGGRANEDLRNILNSGYKHNGSVLRTVPGKDGGEVMPFSTWAPKLLAGIDNAGMPDTIADRCIRIVLKRKRKDQEVERFMYRTVEADAKEIRDAIEKWTAHNLEKIAATEPRVIEEISDRAFEIAEPLLQIAACATTWTKPARAALTALLKQEERPLSLPAQVLQTARTIMQNTNADRITSATLADAMDMSAKRVGVLLAPYGITPQTIRTPNNTLKGYHRRDFEDAWSRYL